MNTRPNQNQNQLVYEVFIRTTPERLWNALVDPAMTQKYFFGTLVRTTQKPGEAIVYEFPDGKRAVSGVIVEADPPRKLVHTWTFEYDEAMAKEKSRVTWLIEKRGDVCKLTAIHDAPEAPKTAEHAAKDGWTVILSAMKTFLETGEPLVVGQRG
jgi:uncharacterized protein YndB with AHSA1/START domain